MTIDEAEKIKLVVENIDLIKQLAIKVSKAMIKAFENLKIEDVNMFKLVYNNAIEDFEEKLLYQIGDIGIRKIIEETAERVKACGEAEEYNGGWIPCSEWLPEERDSIFAKLKGTDKWDNEMFEKCSAVVNVTIADMNDNRITTHAMTKDGKWYSDLLRINTSYRVIAWRPLPQPYKPIG